MLHAFLSRWAPIRVPTVCVAATLLFAAPVASRAVNYYVNDNSTVGDVYCGVVGSDANSGMATNLPKLTITNLRASYTLGRVTSSTWIRASTRTTP
jgi:hypothetical protein